MPERDENSAPSRTINFEEWIEAAKANPAEHLRRQIIEIVLTAIGSTPELRDDLYLKGGTLMNIAYESPRVTKDVDFTTSAHPDGFADFLEVRLNSAMKSAAANLGYVDHICNVQSREMRPPGKAVSWPTLRVKVAYARKGSRQQTRLEKGIGVDVLPLDISFNEPVLQFEEVGLHEGGASIKVYSKFEVIAEKLRAILQMPIRKRDRGQDIFDIARLVRQNEITDSDKQAIFRIFLEKSKSRNMHPARDDISNPEIIERSQARYLALNLEIDQGELDFERDFKQVNEFYRSLPWPD